MNWSIWLFGLVLACIGVALSPLCWDWEEEPGQAAPRAEIDQAMAWVDEYMRNRRVSDEEETA